MASSRCLHPVLEKAVSSRYSIFIYGPAATGKTHIAFSIAECGPEDLNPIVIATEPGTLTYSRHYGLPVDKALTLDELVEKVTTYVVEGRYPIIDTINWPYRSNPGIDSGRMLSFISALLHESGGIAVGQVSLEESMPSGAQYILPWMKMTARTQRGVGGRFMLIVEKPFRRVLAFTIKEGRVEWI